MKRGRIALVVLAAAAAAPSVAPAAPEAKGPPCADITGIQHNYFKPSVESQGTLAVRLETRSGAACSNVQYTLYVVTDEGAQPAAYANTGSLDFTGITVTDDDPVVCVYATTSIGRHVIDVGEAPTSDCAVTDASLGSVTALEISAEASGGRSTFG